MNPRRPISFLVVLALVTAMLYPIPLHRCHASTMPAIFQTGSAAHDGPAGPSCCGADLSKCGCKHRGGAAPAKGDLPTGIPGNQLIIDQLMPGGDCGCITIPHFTVDPAVLSSPSLLTPPDASFIPSSLVALHGLAPAPATRFPIGSSPPYLASRDHYTYLRTSTLLI